MVKFEFTRNIYIYIYLMHNFQTRGDTTGYPKTADRTFF